MNKREIGNKAEDIASKYLLDKGFKILERNFHSRYGEIDIIALDKDTIVFIEVKYRKNNNFGTPLESISLSKIKSICKTAKFYLKSEEKDSRFDVISIESDNIEHITNAFEYIL